MKSQINSKDEFLDFIARIEEKKIDQLSLDLEVGRHLQLWSDDLEYFLTDVINKTGADFSAFNLSLYGKDPNTSVNFGEKDLVYHIEKLFFPLFIFLIPPLIIAYFSGPIWLLLILVYWPILVFTLNAKPGGPPYDLPEPAALKELPATYTPVTLGDLWEAVRKGGWPPDGWEETVARRREALIAERAAAGLDEFGWRRRGR